VHSVPVADKKWLCTVGIAGEREEAGPRRGRASVEELALNQLGVLPVRGQQRGMGGEACKIRSGRTNSGGERQGRAPLVMGSIRRQPAAGGERSFLEEATMVRGTTPIRWTGDR